MTFAWIGLLVFFLQAAEIKPDPAVSLSSPAAVALTPWASCRVLFKFSVKPGYHIQANPAAEPYLIAADLKVSSVPGISVGLVKYPEGQTYLVKGLERNLKVYTGIFQVSLALSASPAAALGRRELTGKFRYQACDDKTCFFPESLPVRLTAVIATPKTPTPLPPPQRGGMEIGNEASLCSSAK